MDKSKAAPVPLKWRRQALPPAPPEDGRPEEPWHEGNRSDADSEEHVQFVTSRTPSSESEDFLRALPERPDDEYDDAPGRAQLVATLRELLEEEQSETSQGAQKAETARLPTPPAAPAEDLQVNEEFALEEEFQEEENIEHDVNVQLQLDDSLAMSAVEDSQQPLQEPAEKRGRLGSALRARAKAFARGRASKSDGKGKKKSKSQAQSPPASLPRANSRLSEMSSASFVFDDEEEEMSSESQLKRSFRCFSCRFQCSLSCISFQIYVLALALAVAGAIYMGLEGPEVQLGAFDLWTQVQKPGSQDSRYFAFARRSALGLRHALPLGPANASAARQWHSIELFWEMGASEEQKLQDFQPEVISDAYMSRVHAAEAQVQALTGWSSFCNVTPAEVQFLCRPGDSLPALAFGTWEAPNFNEQILGMKWKVWFNGQGRGTQIPVETLLTFTREVEPSLLERWLSQGADSADQEDARRLLRSTFLFYFPSEELPSFLRFVDEELRPFLVQLQDASEEASGGLRGFFRIDGRDLLDLPRYFRHEELSICTPLITLVAVQLTTRRALLSLGAAAVVAAAVAAAAAAEGRQAAAGILAWPYLAASAVEIAIACSSIISYNRVLMMRLNVLDPKGMKAAFLWRSPWREKCIAWLQMPLQLFAPTLTAVVVLQALSSLANDVPMVQEFAGPALLGMFVLLLFGPLLFVPAVLLGDAAADRRLFEASGLKQLLPKEIASTPETAAQRRGRRRYALFVATRYSYWLACPTLTVSALILIVIVAANSQVLLEAETPYLFDRDHIFHRAQEVKAKAGGLPSPDVMAATVLRNASSCQIGADASLQCSWYSCTAQTSVVDLAGLCECDYRLEAAETRCYATARFAGLTEPLEGFWEWANATLASRNTSLKGARLNSATWSLASPLELEDWDSGRNFLQKQIASQLPATAPEDCFEAQCYCGSARCNRTNRWLRLGRLSAPGSNASSDPGAGGSNATETMEVVVVWGDKVGQALDLASLEAQRQLYAFCAATMPDLEILSRSCWALDFKLWLEARGEKFPVQTQNFWAFLESFAADEGMEKYFWYETGVGLVGTFAIFSVPLVSEEEAATVRGRWEYYLSLRPGIPSQPWLVAEALQVDPAETLQDLGRSMALIVAPVLGLAMCVLGCSVTLGLAAAAATGLSTAVLIACAPLGPQDGVLQLLCLVIFSAASVAPIVRFLLFYSSARNGPGKRVKNEPSEAMDFERKVPDFTSQPQESLPRDERNRFKSMASSEDQHLQELQQRWAQVSADRRELQSTFRAAAISSERKLRSTTALRHSAEILLGYAISAPLCWLMMFLAAPTALGQVARVFILMACVLPAVTLCGLPILILGGLGPSRVWRQALVAFLSATTGLARRLGGPACSDPELRSPKDDEEEVRKASKVLGWPFTRLGQSWLKRRGAKLSMMAPTEVTPTRG